MTMADPLDRHRHKRDLMLLGRNPRGRQAGRGVVCNSKNAASHFITISRARSREGNMAPAPSSSSCEIVATGWPLVIRPVAD